MEVKTVEFKPFTDQKPGTYVTTFLAPKQKAPRPHQNREPAPHCHHRFTEAHVWCLTALGFARRSPFSSNLTTARPSLPAFCFPFPKVLKVGDNQLAKFALPSRYHADDQVQALSSSLAVMDASGTPR